MVRTLDMDLGFWDDSIKFIAVIKKNLLFAIHQEEERFFNVPELMGMPHDFELDHVKNINHVCQMVPVNMARDWAARTRWSILQGELELSEEIMFL